jgi:hypothetical protein
MVMDLRTAIFLWTNAMPTTGQDRDCEGIMPRERQCRRDDLTARIACRVKEAKITRMCDDLTIARGEPGA